jgi:endonuclease I
MGMLCLFSFACAQGPNGSGTYYQAADGQKGFGLKTALFNIIKNPEVVGYGDLWQAYKETDVTDNGHIWDMYSNITYYVPGGIYQGANITGKEGESYNREHSFPKSWFGSQTPMYSDIVHVIPTDGYVNTRRNNNPYGTTNGETFSTVNGFSKLGKCTWNGYQGIVFEPNDEYKGDLARIYFYMATCYEDVVMDWSSDMLGGSDKSQPFADWAFDMLMQWSKDDPVSQKEIDRNNRCYVIQGNRNPFVDYPGLEEYVWGSKSDESFSYDVGGEVITPVEGSSTQDVAKGVQIYKRVTSHVGFQTGLGYVIAREKDRKAFGAMAGNYGSSVNVRFYGDTIATEVDGEGLIHQFTIGKAAEGYTLYDAVEKKFLAASGSNLSLVDDPSQSAAQWRISFGGGYAALENVAAVGRYLRYQDGTGRFLLSNSQEWPSLSVRIYKNITDVASLPVHYGEPEEEEIIIDATDYEHRWDRVSTQEELQTGEQYLIVYEKTRVAMGDKHSKNYYTNVEIPLKDNIAVTEVNTGGVPHSFTLGGDYDAYTLKDDSANVYVSLNNDGNALYTAVTISDKARWKITISETDSTAMIQNCNFADRYLMYNSSNPRFACYKSTMKPVYLYKKYKVPETDAIFIVRQPEQQALEGIYNLQGQRVEHPTQGIYIKNGKKYIVK